MFETRLLRCNEYILTLKFVFQDTLYHGHWRENTLWYTTAFSSHYFSLRPVFSTNTELFSTSFTEVTSQLQLNFRVPQNFRKTDFWYYTELLSTGVSEEAPVSNQVSFITYISILYDRKMFYPLFICIYDHFKYNVAEIIGTSGLQIIRQKRYCVFLGKPLCKKIITFISQIKANKM